MRPECIAPAPAPEVPKHYKRRGKNYKPFVIEFRYPKCGGFLAKLFDGSWQTWKRYESRAQRAQAMDALRKNAGRGWNRCGMTPEFREADDE